MTMQSNELLIITLIWTSDTIKQTRTLDLKEGDGNKTMIFRHISSSVFAKQVNRKHDTVNKDKAFEKERARTCRYIHNGRPL